MFFGILTLLTALAISAVAIYYSVAGLVAIFAAAAIPIIIMGSTLEIAKLVTAVWLHWYWTEANWWIKTYLTAAVIVLMFITSMGIFGFLSKAHIEQTAIATENIQLINNLNLDIERQQSLIEKYQNSITLIESKTSNQESTIQDQIDREQDRIDTAYARIQPAIDDQLLIISTSEKNVQTRILSFSNQINEIDQILRNLQEALSANNIKVAQGIVGERQDGALGPATSRAIQSFREDQISKRNQLVDRIEEISSEPNTVAEQARNEIARLRSFAEQQILDSNTLISRLRGQIGISDQSTIDLQIEEEENKIRLANTEIDNLMSQRFAAEKEYRLLEAEVGPIKYIAEFVYGDADKDLLEEAVRWVIIIIIFVFDPLAVLLLIASQYTFEFEKRRREAIKKDKTYDISSEHNDKSTTNSEEPINTDRQTSNEVESESIGVGHEGRGLAVQERRINSSLEEIREQELKDIDNDADWRDAKHRWKEDNPNETLKEWKQRYVSGEINQLPWEEYLSSYKQNEEQSENSIWNRIRNKNE